MKKAQADISLGVGRRLNDKIYKAAALYRSQKGQITKICKKLVFAWTKPGGEKMVKWWFLAFPDDDPKKW